MANAERETSRSRIFLSIMPLDLKVIFLGKVVLELVFTDEAVQSVLQCHGAMVIPSYWEMSSTALRY